MRVTVTSPGLDQLIERLDGFRWTPERLQRLGDRLAPIIAESNREAIAEGIDWRGDEVAELSPATVATRKGTGPPRAPEGESSRMVSGLLVEVEPVGDDRVNVVGTWPGVPFVRFHRDGTDRMPARDPCGITPAAWERIKAEVRAFIFEEFLI